jgi:cleavage and polyadenylation specificity factor subunit 1
MHAIRQEILPPSGVEFATSLKLLPSAEETLPVTQDPKFREEFTARTLCNVIVARSNLLRIFEVREEPAPVSLVQDEERDRRAKVRKGTEAVEGEVEMDTQGDGFVNIAKVISLVYFSARQYIICFDQQHVGLSS